MRSSADRRDRPQRRCRRRRRRGASIALITSANIACGGHAGDAGSMREAVRSPWRTASRSARTRATRDRDGLQARRSLAPEPLARAVAAQVAALLAIADAVGRARAPRQASRRPLQRCRRDERRRLAVAEGVAVGLARVDPRRVGGSPALGLWRERGFRRRRGVRGPGLRGRRHARSRTASRGLITGPGRRRPRRSDWHAADAATRSAFTRIRRERGDRRRGSSRTRRCRFAISALDTRERGT